MVVIRVVCEVSNQSCEKGVRCRNRGFFSRGAKWGCDGFVAFLFSWWMGRVVRIVVVNLGESYQPIVVN